MKASQLIEALENMIARYGDLDVVSAYRPSFTMSWPTLAKPVQNIHGKKRGEIVDPSKKVFRV